MQNKRSLLRIVNMEYALIQGLYWIGFCGIVSYAAVYLQARGYSNTQLGRILAAGYILGFLFPQILANLIDRYEKITVYRCQWLLLILQVALVFFLREIPGKGSERPGRSYQLRRCPWDRLHCFCAVLRSAREMAGGDRYTYSADSFSLLHRPAGSGASAALPEHPQGIRRLCRQSFSGRGCQRFLTVFS